MQSIWTHEIDQFHETQWLSSYYSIIEYHFSSTQFRFFAYILVNFRLSIQKIIKMSWKKIVFNSHHYHRHHHYQQQQLDLCESLWRLEDAHFNNNKQKKRKKKQQNFEIDWDLIYLILPLAGGLLLLFSRMKKPKLRAPTHERSSIKCWIFLKNCAKRERHRENV